MSQDVIAICTRNRADDLADCLRSIATQTRPPTGVLVVDGSDGTETRDLVVGAAADFPVPIDYVATGPGLAPARNLALRSTDADFVHFVDDDAVLEDGYVAGIMACFEADPLVGAVGGVITDLEVATPSRAARFLMLDSLAPGRVLPSGHVSLVGDVDTDLDVDWVSGCTMSLRRSAIPPGGADERLETPADGEDVDLTYRIAQHWRVVITPAARLEHHMSPVGRFDAVKRERQRVLGRYRRATGSVGRLRAGAFWFSAVGQAAYYGLFGLLRRSRTTLRMSQAISLGMLGAIRLRAAPAAPPAPEPPAEILLTTPAAQQAVERRALSDPR